MLNKIYEKIKQFSVKNFKLLIILGTVVTLCLVKLPLVVNFPGGVIDITNRIKIKKAYPTKGKIMMSYVSMAQGHIPLILLSYIIPNWDLEPLRDVTYEDNNLTETLEIDQYITRQSIDHAIIASYHLANHPIRISKYHHTVMKVNEQAQTDLKVFDEIIAINDVSVTSYSWEQCKELIKNYRVGELIKFQVLRKGKIKKVEARVRGSVKERLIGIGLITTYDLETDPQIKINFKKSASGPSGGLMMALTIYNKLVPFDITKGKTIAGTGTINLDGTVGGIGGIKYKILGAIKNGVDIFLCPSENYKEAQEVLSQTSSKMQLFKVKSLEDALTQLT